MSDNATPPVGHARLRLQNFTAFEDCTLEFVPGINVFVGENGTGKTHAMKALYASTSIWHAASASRQVPSILELIGDLFQSTGTGGVVRLGAPSGVATVSGNYQSETWEFVTDPAGAIATAKPQNLKVERPVFIPAIDMIGHSKGFLEAYREVRLDFDSTCVDIVSLLRLEKKDKSKLNGATDKLSEVLGGNLERDDDGRFYITTPTGRLAMPMVAEGIRKIATIIQLYRNGWLVPGTTLFWDEPEVNLNPILMDELVAALLEISRSGVQIFLATHSYVILKELDLQADADDSVCYFAFQSTPSGTTVDSTLDLSQLAPNPILAQYDSLYDREITRSTGRNRQGERIR